MAYPVGVLVTAIVLNLFVFGISPAVVSLPSADNILSLLVASVLLVVNHTWLMTTTELTRGRFDMYATPEEWAASGTSREDAPELGLCELERRHNAHRNTTENAIYFILFSFIFVLVSPAALAAQVWLIGFAVARLGYTYSYLVGRNNARGLFMSLSLMAMYGIGSYVAMSLVA